MAQSRASLRIGTRGSPLALVQARMVRERLAAAAGLEERAIELVVIRTTGDTIQDRPLAEEGGKGLFTKEIEEALLNGGVDLAVHSAKDMPTVLPDGLVLAACLEREDPRDVFISRKARSLSDLARGASLGTASLRRQAIAKRARPDLRVLPLRGNVETRLRKLDQGEFAAVLLATAGLERLGLGDRISERLAPDQMLPAVGQGVIGIECQEIDSRVCSLLAPLDHPATRHRLDAERAFAARLGGGCQSPIAGFAMLAGERIELRGLVGMPDGSRVIADRIAGPAGDSAMLGAALADRLLAAGADALLKLLAMDDRH